MIRTITEQQAIVSGIQLTEQFAPVEVIPLGRDRWMTTEAARFCIDADIAWVIVEIEMGFVSDMDQPEKLSDWENNFINDLAEKPENYELSEKQNSVLNRIQGRLD